MNALRPLAAVFAFATFVAGAFAAETATPKVSAEQAARRVDAGKAVLVDCREPAEWADTGVAQPAVLLPKSDFDGDQKQWKTFLAENKGRQVILYCRSGTRAGLIAAELAKQGIDTANAGGLKDWTKAGLPTRKVEAKK